MARTKDKIRILKNFTNIISTITSFRNLSRTNGARSLPSDAAREKEKTC